MALFVEAKLNQGRPAANREPAAGRFMSLHEGALGALAPEASSVTCRKLGGGDAAIAPVLGTGVQVIVMYATQ